MKFSPARDGCDGGTTVGRAWATTAGGGTLGLGRTPVRAYLPKLRENGPRAGWPL